MSTQSWCVSVSSLFRLVRQPVLWVVDFRPCLFGVGIELITILSRNRRLSPTTGCTCFGKPYNRSGGLTYSLKATIFGCESESTIFSNPVFHYLGSIYLTVQPKELWRHFRFFLLKQPRFISIDKITKWLVPFFRLLCFSHPTLI